MADDPERDPLAGEDPRLTSLDERLAKVRADEDIRSGKHARGSGKG